MLQHCRRLFKLFHFASEIPHLPLSTYLDGKKLVDVVKAALDNNMMVDDMKAVLIKENPGHEVTFKVQ